MIYEYWTISYRPTPMSLSTYGMGVVVGDPETGDFKHKIISRSASRIPPKQGKENIHAVVDALVGKLDRLKASASNSFEFEVPMDPKAWLKRASKLFQNHLIVRGPRYVEHESISEALLFLFETLIDEKVSETGPQKRIIVKRAIVSEYESRASISPLVVHDPMLLLPNELDRELDVAVLGKEIFELDFAFNFGGDPTKAVRAYADSWALRISGIREGKANLGLSGSERVKIDSNVPITAVIYPPVDQKQKELFAKSTALWRELEIDIVDYHRLPKHANDLEERIAS